MKLTVDLHLVLMLRMSAVVPPFPSVRHCGLHRDSAPVRLYLRCMFIGYHLCVAFTSVLEVLESDEPISFSFTNMEFNLAVDLEYFRDLWKTFFFA